MAAEGGETDPLEGGGRGRGVEMPGEKGDPDGDPFGSIRIRMSLECSSEKIGWDEWRSRMDRSGVRLDRWDGSDPMYGWTVDGGEKKLSAGPSRFHPKFTGRGVLDCRDVTKGWKERHNRTTPMGDPGDLEDEGRRNEIVNADLLLGWWNLQEPRKLCHACVV